MEIMSTSAIANIKRFELLKQENSWEILRRANAFWVLGLLSDIFKTTSRVPRSAFYQEVKKRLKYISLHLDMGEQEAPEYINDWLNQKILATSVNQNNDEELFELTKSAHLALQFINSLESDDVKLNDSYMHIVMSQVHQLCIQTSEDVEEKISELQDKRRLIDIEIGKLKKGEITHIDNEKAKRDFKTIVNLVSSLDGDFFQVTQDIREVDQSIREAVISMDESTSKGEILQRTFDNIEELYSRPSGKSFRSFWSVMIDSNLQAKFDDDLNSLLSRDFIKTIDRPTRRVIEQLSRNLLNKGLEVTESTASISRSLHSFVKLENIKEHRLVSKLLNECLVNLVEVKDQLTNRDSVLEVTLPKLYKKAIRGVDLYSEKASFGVPKNAISPQFNLQDAKHLASSTDINYRRLVFTVNKAIRANGTISIADIINEYPIEDGIASVIGYLILANKHASITDCNQEVIFYRNKHTLRVTKLLIPQVFFSELIDKSAVA